MNDLREKLGARSLANAISDLNSVATFENKYTVQLPSVLRNLLTDIQGAVIFDKGAKFKPECISGREDAMGYLSLEMLYGGQVLGDNSLEEVNVRLSSEISPSLIIIGESSGGDQICFNKVNGEVIFWMHDVAPNGSEVSVAKDFDQFVRSLESDEDNNDSAREVIEGESFLDF